MSSLNIQQVSLSSQQDLDQLLAKFPDIDTGTWIKSVSSLYNEVKTGECILEIEDGKLHRRVDIVSVKCFHTNDNGERFQLFEERQIFKNGNTRERGYKFIAEKLQLGESPEQAAIRGIAEELQISGPEVHVISLPEENTFERKESSAYKGLQSSYNIYFFSCEISANHYKNTYVEEQQDKSTFFSWFKI